MCFGVEKNARDCKINEPSDCEKSCKSQKLYKDLRGSVLKSTQLNKDTQRLNTKNAQRANKDTLCFDCVQVNSMQTTKSAKEKQAKWTNLIIKIIMCFLLLSFVVSMTFIMLPKHNAKLNLVSAWSGSGTESSPYEITSIDDLKTLATNVNTGTTYSGKYFSLVDNIVTTDTTWTPIGTSTYPFAGAFDGRGHTITFSAEEVNFTTNNFSQVGLFGYTGETATITSLLLDCTISDSLQYIAGLAGVNNGTINKCAVRGDIKSLGYFADDGAGGIVYENNGVVSNCYYTGNLTLDDYTDNREKIPEDENVYVGGIVAINNSGGVVNNCWVSGTMNGASSHSNIVVNLGAVTSKNLGQVSRCVYLNTLPTDETDSRIATESQMKLASTYTNLGWSTSDWILVDGELPQLNIVVITTVNLVVNATLSDNIGFVIINILQNETIVGQYAISNSQIINIELSANEYSQIVVSKPYFCILTINNRACNSTYDFLTQSSDISVDLEVSGNANWNNALII